MRTPLAALVVALMIFAAPSIATAQCPKPEKPKPRDPDAILPGFRYGIPQKLSAYSGSAWGAGFTPTCADFVTLTVDFGVAGGQLSVGHGMSGRRFGILRAQGSMLRTWGHPWKARSDAWYAGTELQWAYFLGIRLGRFWQLGGRAPSQNITAVSIVAGF